MSGEDAAHKQFTATPIDFTQRYDQQRYFIFEK